MTRVPVVRPSPDAALGVTPEATRDVGAEGALALAVARSDAAADLCRRGHDLLARCRSPDALDAFRTALLLTPSSAAARLGYNRALRRVVPRWHFAMMNDHARNGAFADAIARVVTPGSLVLDIGSGSALLAMMAARAGAAKVVTCEGIPEIADVARRIVRANGFADRIDVVAKWSTDLVVGADLPRKADVLTTEIVDCCVLGEQIARTLHHARRHLLRRDATILPRAAKVYAQLVESPAVLELNHVGDIAGFDLREFNSLSTLEYFSARIGHFAHRPLTPPVEVFDFRFTRDVVPERRAVEIRPTASGTCHAIVSWFEMELVPGVEVSNGPMHHDSHWKQAVQVLTRPVDVSAGAPVTLSARHDCDRVLFDRVGDVVVFADDGVGA